MEKRKKISLALLPFVFLLACVSGKKEKIQALPYYGNADIVVSIIDGEEVTDTIYPKIPHFNYLNQDSVWIDSKKLSGKVWVANFFFSQCPSICPPMMTQLKRLYQETNSLRNELIFLSFSIDPKNDTPFHLKNYSEKTGITTKNWHLLTGNEAATHRLGVDHFMVTANNDPSAPGGFAHSDGFVLVDRKGYVRGIYNGTQPTQVDLLKNDLKKLLKLEYGVTSSKN